MNHHAKWIAIVVIASLTTVSNFGQAAPRTDPVADSPRTHLHRPGIQAARTRNVLHRRTPPPRSSSGIRKKTTLEKEIHAKRRKIVAAGLGAASVGAAGLSYATRNSHPHVSTAAACVGFACAAASRAVAGSAEWSELKLKKKALGEQHAKKGKEPDLERGEGPGPSGHQHAGLPSHPRPPQRRHSS
jgi:hypothetical protein